MGNTKIEWTDITVNPIHLIREDGSNGGHWCHKVSPGCANCYAEAQNQSNYFKFASHLPYTGEVPQNLIFDEKVMKKLLNMRSPKKIFLCSMTDLFGEWVPDEWIDKIFAYMAMASQHTFQILTKRAERMQNYFDGLSARRINEAAYKIDKTRIIPFIPLPNVWLGVSVENQKAADDRIPLLLATPAKIIFLSCEPLLEAIDLRKHFRTSNSGDILTWLDYLHFIIIGGESGSKARPCDVNWIRSIVQQCKPTNVAVFVKQLGSRSSLSSGLSGLKHHKGGDINEFPEELKIRQLPSEKL
ncbi:MAG: hypothetical protein AV945_gp40 [Phormidium phage MIS-PhV1B]|jgi:Bacteriophage protein gp37|uniref:hypothetical protein n=1 Tax=Phormidium phage MIS-PhV1B TaxID=1391456 RepID=UPI0003C9869B|nr:MAG: hypothetical protein AV945_gp40 [Phormidium phage MIS-PhV1B]YP_009220279.1 MAG: hypothetical protein AV945_gp40 [Phormidium phage MIS-PhV1A]AGZ61785.1 MAG: hypothetical protein [Phormidium phage MIS-PhV1A]AGZ61847.1 MAG: hypothetical protein [Phormidium phage MIS-PhV1B]